MQKGELGLFREGAQSCRLMCRLWPRFLAKSQPIWRTSSSLCDLHSGKYPQPIGTRDLLAKGWRHLNKATFRWPSPRSASDACGWLGAGGAGGVGGEYWRRPVNAESIVKRYFSPGEASRWQALADHEQPPAFFRGWTRKEVYFKARDVGLSAGLDRFEVSLAPPS